MNKEDLLRQLREHKFPDKIIKAFHEVDRGKFVPEKYLAEIHGDYPISLGFGQTTSQPYTIAFMLTLLDLKNRQKILEVGSGGGYVLELIAHASKESQIFGIERIQELAESSMENLKSHRNIKVVQGDGSKGLGESLLFDRILVSATADEIPQNLLNELKFGGIMVVPVRNSIVRIKKSFGENKITEYPGFSFVPLV